MTESIPKKYALSLKDTLLSPAIEGCVFGYLKQAVDWPTGKSLKDFAILFGHKDGAIRTALSRAQKSNELITVSSKKDKRFKAGPVIENYVNYFLQDKLSTPSFSLIIAQFYYEETTQRHFLKDRLLRLGYVKFAPNTFLRYGGDSQSVNYFLAQQQLQKSVYHFEALKTLPTNLEKQLPKLYKLAHWAKELEAYEVFLKHYLAQEKITSQTGYLRYLYIRSAFHKKIMTHAPQLPEAYFPEGHRLRTMYQHLGQLAHEHQHIFAEHYQTFFG